MLSKPNVSKKKLKRKHDRQLNQNVLHRKQQRMLNERDRKLKRLSVQGRKLKQKLNRKD